MAEMNSRFDCVEFKRQAQEKLQAEYEARKSEFPSYPAFLEAKTRESEWASAIWEKVSKAAKIKA